MQNQIGEGNHARAWNDPPQLSYESTGNAMRSKPLRNLKQRVAVPLTGSRTADENSNRKPDVTAGPPKSMASGSSLKCDSPNPVSAPKVSQINRDEQFSSMQTDLSSCLEDLRPHISSASREEIEQRIEKFKTAWQHNLLNAEIEQRMCQLAKDLVSKDYDKAWSLHRSMIVDYTSICTPWMTGIKALIAAARQCNSQGSQSKD